MIYLILTKIEATDVCMLDIHFAFIVKILNSTWKLKSIKTSIIWKIV